MPHSEVRLIKVEDDGHGRVGVEAADLSEGSLHEVDVSERIGVDGVRAGSWTRSPTFFFFF